ncbi:transcriptional repressor NrdR [Patescibacteria group bacterium]|nr:transcriptional repressor NrdR [Patescibacteria group bacterium]
MRCPVCEKGETRVIDSRVLGNDASIRRRRQCDACEFRFSTLEEMELLDLTVVKRDGRREGYVREKLERGVRRALEKRSYTEASFRSLMQTIELDLQRERASEVTSARIGEVLMNRLKAFDKVAYIRFASVYRSFEDVETFQQELAELAPKKRLTKKASPSAQKLID